MVDAQFTNPSSTTSEPVEKVERKKVAVIGAGISGLSCAYLLADKYQVEVFEAGDELGGHTATKTVSFAGEQYNVDTGFIVFNDRTYPNFLKLLHKLGVDYQKTSMGFSVTNRITGYEYAGTSLNGLFAQRRVHGDAGELAAGRGAGARRTVGAVLSEGHQGASKGESVW